MIDGYHETAGTFTTRWRGTDSSGRSVAAGVYLCRLESGGLVETRTMVLLP